MTRVAPLLLCALLVAVTRAAPAPVPKPSKVWVTGWDKHVDLLGDCQFHLNRDKLIITVPGRGHELDVFTDRLNAPHLLRDVGGDFAVQVRVGGDFRHVELVGRGVQRRAGILLTDGKTFVRLQRVAGVDDLRLPVPGGMMLPLPLCIGVPDRHWSLAYKAGPPLGKPAYLRLERRGDLLTMAFSQTGKEWTQTGWLSEEMLVRLPKKLKVGVLAESTAEGTFKAEFDQFKLTPLSAKTRTRVSPRDSSSPFITRLVELQQGQSIEVRE